MPTPSPAETAAPPISADPALLEARVAEAAALLASLGHPARLMLLCHLGGGEMSVGEINQRVALSQPALSQHLARLRVQGHVATRRAGATIFYRIANPAVGAIIETLRRHYCPPPD